MAIAPKNNYEKRELPPAGTHLARLYSIIEIGTQSFIWEGQEKKTHKVRLTWELPTEMRVFNEEKGEQPMVISEEVGFSMHEKATLRKKIVHGMIGTSLTDKEADSFDIDKLLGMECLLNIIHEEKPKGMFAKINSISTLMKGQTCPAQINPTVTLYFNDWKPEVFENLPKFIKEKIMASPEYQSMSGSAHTVNNGEISVEDIPF
jgi:hypothetical protein